MNNEKLKNIINSIDVNFMRDKLILTRKGLPKSLKVDMLKSTKDNHYDVMVQLLTSYIMSELTEINIKDMYNHKTLEEAKQHLDIMKNQAEAITLLLNTKELRDIIPMYFKSDSLIYILYALKNSNTSSQCNYFKTTLEFKHKLPSGATSKQQITVPVKFLSQNAKTDLLNSIALIKYANNYNEMLFKDENSNYIKSLEKKFVAFLGEENYKLLYSRVSISGLKLK